MAKHVAIWIDHKEARISSILPEEIVRALEGVEEVLVVGPSTAKLELHRFLHKHAHVIESKIVGIETVDHPTDGQLVAYARNSVDRLAGCPS